MYKDYYRLQTEPFSTHPNTATFFVSNTHKEAWYYLLFGIDTQEPFLVLTGEYGMGKTLLCLRLIKVLKEKGMPRVEYIPTSNEGYGGILRRMASSLGISPLPEDEEILQDMIYDRFRTDTENSRFYLIIDDAHELDTTILTKLKYLSTFNHNEFFPVIMIFVGHPSFLQDLRTPALSSLNQRIKRRYHLAKFSLGDTKDYIYFRLLRSGATGVPAFPDETIQKIFEYSGGVPRLINNICDTCLLLGASKKLISIPPAVVDDARKLVEGSLIETKEEAKIDSDSPPPNDAATVITFSEDLPSIGVAKSEPTISATDKKEEYQPPEIIHPQVPIVRKNNWIRGVIAAVVAILLILSGVLLSQFLMNDDKVSTYPAPAIPNSSQNGPVQPAAGGIPALREELTDKPASETLVPANLAQPTTSAPVNTFTKQTVGVDAQPSSKAAVAPAGVSEQFASHPFSLRSSSYQQIDAASQELSEIKKMGLTPYLVKADLGDMGTLWRVYIGFYATEEEALKIKTTYKLANAAVQKTEYACQVGQFSNETDSLNVFERLKQAGYSPYAIQKGRNNFILFVGAYERKSEADALYQELQRKGIKSQIVKR